MNQRRVSVVVFDLDNTLWDWVHVWYESFSALLDILVKESELSRDELIPAIRKVHRKRGTSEYTFLIEELEPLREKHGSDARLEILYVEAIRAFREARAEALSLYPTVLETLWALRNRGCLLVGYTESMAYYTNYRLRELGLDGLLDFLYSPASHDLPQGLTDEQKQRFAADEYRLQVTRHRHTPPGELKPNPHLLQTILSEVGASVDQAIYVGDSLMKDIAMAQDAGVVDVYAAYGNSRDTDAYDLLKAVTHWTDEDVARENAISARGEVTPTYTLDHCLSQLLTHFEFVPHAGRSDERGDPSLVQHKVEVWKKIIDVQQHFNDLELRIRNYAVTLLVAVLGAAALGIKEGIRVPIGPVEPSLGSLIVLAGLVGWVAFYLMDRFWYHRLLYGAVKQGGKVEEELASELPNIGLTDAIGKESPVYLGRFQIRSTRKMDIFYGLVFILLLLVVAASWQAVPPSKTDVDRLRVEVESWPSPPAATLVSPVGAPTQPEGAAATDSPAVAPDTAPPAPSGGTPR